MNWKSLTLLLISFAGSHELIGQNKYLNGFIVNNENDTLYGQILNGTDSELASEISFADNRSGSKEKQYTVSDLKIFGFSHGRIFERIPVKEDHDGSNHVFAKKVLSGKVDTWVWRQSASNPDIFLRNNENGKFAHLSKGEDTLIIKDGKDYKKKNTEFIGLMKYVTDDQIEIGSGSRNLKYQEKRILDQIHELNTESEDQFPVSRYSEEVQHQYDIFFGIPFRTEPNSTHFRAGIYRRNIRVERSTQLSYLRGITYHGWHSHKSWDDSFESGFSNYRWQLLSLIPMGVHYQGKNRVLKPYIFGGIGLGILALTDYVIEDYQNTGSKTMIIPFPTVNAGAGLKVKLWAIYAYTELTTSLEGSFINFGLSF